jgi:hypothetical protein
MKEIIKWAALACGLSLLSCQASSTTEVEFAIGMGAIDAQLEQGGGSLIEDSLLPSLSYTDSNTVRISNGSVLNFAAGDAVGSFIRFASSANDVPNPLCISHSGLVVNDDPRVVYEILNGLRSGSMMGDYQPQPAALDLMLRNLRARYSNLLGFPGSVDAASLAVVPFCLQANGTPTQVLTGITPHVQIEDLYSAVEIYNGNVFVRPLCKPVPLESTRAFLKAHIGRPYEGFLTFADLLRAPMAANKTEDIKRLFCSELVALFYRTYCGLSISNVSNVIPESFGSGAGEYDLLRSIASREIPLKLRHNFSTPDPDGYCCRGCLLF